MITKEISAKAVEMITKEISANPVAELPDQQILNN